MQLLLKGGTVVFPSRGVIKADIGITDGKISHIGVSLEAKQSEKTLDVSNKVIFPGLIDSHFHVGIYRPLSQDALSESASAVAGGVTTILSYFRAGRNYLNTSGPYSTLYANVLKLSAGNFYCDYGYHLAPITKEHVKEIPTLVKEHGVSTFKYYMFYRGLVLKGEFRKGAVEKEYLLSDDPYDLGHLKQMMEKIKEVGSTTKGVRLSIHAEDAEIIRTSLERSMADVEKTSLNPLEAYSSARPPSSERLAMIQAVELANQTGCPVNILHVSSELGLSTIRQLRSIYPETSIMVETTVHHLTLTTDSRKDVSGKVNPPIRRDSDKESLWEGIKSAEVNTVASDHACITSNEKGRDIWTAEPGFGGTELLLPSLITEGHLKRGLPLERIAELVTSAPARYHGLQTRKGDIAIGYDADIAICDLSKTKIVDHKQLHSAQDFSPFDGLELSGWVDTTILRGEIVYEGGKTVGKPGGQYLKRPVPYQTNA